MSVKQAINHFYQHYVTGFTPCLWVAVSGGIDSVVLLHALIYELGSKLPIKAIHVNHQYCAEAWQWQQFCESLAQQLGVDLKTVYVTIETDQSEGFEAQARRKRYRAMADYISDDELLLTAHHQQDQAETVLLQLMRGSGVDGLAAMPVIQSWGSGFLGRPLLGVSPQSIEAYAQHHQLNWVEDPSNQDDTFRRNFMRHQVLPLLREQWPSCDQVLADTAQRMQSSRDILCHVSQQDEQQATITPYQVDLTVLHRLSSARCYQFLYYWLKYRHGFQVNHDHLTVIIDEVINAPQDAQPVFELGVKNYELNKWQLRRYQSCLYLINIAELADTQSWCVSWPDPCEPLKLPEPLGCLTLTQHNGAGLLIQPSDELWVCFRQGGEKLYLPHRKGQKSLKTLMQAWQIPPWQRDQVPLLYINDQLAAVVSYAIAAPFYTAEYGWQLCHLSY